MNKKPSDVPGYTHMYSFGIKVFSERYIEYCVMTVRASSEYDAIRHIQAIFRGRYRLTELKFFTDMEEWKREAKPDEVNKDGH